MLLDAMRPLAPPHTRHTSGEAVSADTAEPGTVAENPPTIDSSWVMWPPRLRTRSSAAGDRGALSRTITGKACPGCAWARENSTGSAFASTPAAWEAGGCTSVAAMNSTRAAGAVRTNHRTLFATFQLRGWIATAWVIELSPPA